MTRKKEFIEEDVLDRAMRTFWQNGYAATSIDDLVASTGLHRGSLYNAFGGKHALLKASIDRYGEVVGSRSLQFLNGEGSAKQRILRFFEDFIDRLSGDPQRRGCLITNSAMELAPRDPEISAMIAAYLMKLEDAMCALIERGQSEGEMDPGRDPRSTARYLVSSLQGLRVTARVFPERSALDDIAGTIISVIG